MDARALGEHFRSNVVGYIALFCFAISGTAYALPGLNSVNSGDIKNRQVKRMDLAYDSVRSQNVIDGSLTNADLAAGILADGSVTSPKLANDAVTAAKIVDNSLFAEDLGADSVGSSELQTNAVGSGEVADNSLTGTDLEGADLSGGGITIPTGYVPNGRCRQLDASVGGAEAGQAVLFSVQAALQDGVMIYGQGVPSDGHVTFDVCNFSGTTQSAISDLPVHVLTFE
jgi:hypothetical protein